MSSLSSENPSFTVSSVETREPGLFLQEVSQCLGIQQLFPEVNNHVRCLWMDCMAKWPVTIFMEEWFKKKKKLKKRQISRTDPMPFRIFEQLKEDSSANMSNKTVAYFFTCFLHCLCYPIAFVYNIWVIFPLLLQLVICLRSICVDRETVDTIGGMGAYNRMLALRNWLSLKNSSRRGMLRNCFFSVIVQSFAVLGSSSFIFLSASVCACFFPCTVFWTENLMTIFFQLKNKSYTNYSFINRPLVR